MSRRAEGSLFVGRLGKNSRVRDLEDVFEPYGRMSRCEIKYGAEMAYAFVDYEDRRDAEDAIRYENGREVAGSAIIVEWAKGNPRRGGRDSRDMRESSRGSRPPDGDNQTRPQKSDNLRSVSNGKGYDECYRCHKSGHWARDCPDDHHYGFRRPSARRSRSPRRSSNRSRSRSRSRGHIRSRSRSRSPRGSRDRGSRDRGSRDRASRDSKRRRTRSRTHSRSRSYDRKASRSRSRSRSKSRSRSRTPEDKATNGAKSRSPSKSPDRDKSASPV